MKEEILKLIKDKPKHYSSIIKRNDSLLSWVNENSLFKSSNLAEMIYSAVYSKTNICSKGNIQKFESMTNGFIGCGPAKICECTREKVANSVKQTKSQVSNERQIQINQKRQQTNLKKYGVINVAQTEENKKKFKEWYADSKNVETILEKIKKTNLEKYGVENCKSLPEVEQKIIATCLAKYGVTNVSQIPSTKMKLRARIAEYKLNGHLLNKGYDRFCEYILKNYDHTVLTEKETYRGYQAHNELKFQCNNCKTAVSKKFSYGVGLRCNQCNPITTNYVSQEQQEIFDFITQELKIKGYQSDKSLINPFELDMVFPDYKIAIEYCGLYWHSEHSSGKNRRYHYDKMIKTNSCGYRLITIFSDEWLNRREIVRSKLTNIFGLTKVRHFARNLSVKEVNHTDSEDFLNRYHLQGSSTAKINLGLYDNDRLLSLMTFSNGRAALNSSPEKDEYELVRFVTNGEQIVGGAGKLLKYFIRKFKPKKIISYADLRWSEGNLYKTLGFEFFSKPTIGYWYVSGYKIREHRFNFTKRRLVNEGADPRKTEWEIMRDLGYDRIWDCGHQKYILNL